MRIRVVDYCNGRSNVASVNVRARVETGDNDDDDDDNDDDDDDNDGPDSSVQKSRPRYFAVWLPV